MSQAATTRSNWLRALTPAPELDGDELPVTTLPGSVTVRTAGGGPLVVVPAASPNFATSSDFPLTITALPASVSLVVYQGDTFALAIDVADELGDPVDLSAATWAAEIRDEPGGELVGTWTVTRTDFATLELLLDHETAAELPARCAYDLATMLGGWRTTLIAGALAVTPRITQWPTGA